MKKSKTTLSIALTLLLMVCLFTGNMLQAQATEDPTLTTLANPELVDSEQELANALASTSITEIELEGDIALAGTFAPLNVVGTKTISSTPGNTFKLYRGAGFKKGMFSIMSLDSSNPATLTLTNIILDGTPSTASLTGIAPLIEVETYGYLYLNDGAVVQNNPANEDGGGIYIGEGGATINGGKVINNSTTGTVGGGGIYNNGTLTLINGSISNNHAPNGSGGGVVNLTNFEQLGGDISNNTAPVGAGVSNQAPHSGPYYASFFMNGGSITNNTATEYGGGINSAGIVTLGDGVISNNTATIAGGGIYISKSKGLSTLSLEGNPQMIGNGIYVDDTLASALTVNGSLQASARILIEGSSVSGQMTGGVLVANWQVGAGTPTEAGANTFMSVDGTLSGTLSGNSVIWKPDESLAKTADTSPLILLSIVALAGLIVVAQRMFLKTDK